MLCCQFKLSVINVVVLLFILVQTIPSIAQTVPQDVVDASIHEGKNVSEYEDLHKLENSYNYLNQSIINYNYSSGPVEPHSDHILLADEESLEMTGKHGEHGKCELKVASVAFENVQTQIIVATFLFISAAIKIVFHHTGFLVDKIPESCLLIVLGTIAGTIFTFATDTETFPTELRTLKPDLFFFVLLPPIVLEASHSIHDRVFFDNIGSILVFAVIGTILSCFMIGPALYGLSYAGVLGGDQFSFIHCMLFAAIIVAVDPVAVLAIFQEVGVNNVLYFLVFGESLLNDAVTVVLYHTIEGISCFLEAGDEITAGMYATALAKFFASSFGGIIVGVLFGAICSFLTKYTVDTRVVEPLLLFSIAYLSYVVCEMFHFSGIIGLTCCGVMQAQYAFHNISHKSYVTVKYFTKMASTASDCVIFLYLGLNLVRLDHVWHTGFTLASVILCLVVRFIVTYGLSFIMNRSRMRAITSKEMFIMAYGGLRGAVAFSLVAMLSGQLDAKIQGTFMTTTLVIVIFTVFIQGGTIKPLVSLLEIRKKAQTKDLKLFDELHDNITDHMLAGIEEIIGNHGQYFIHDFLIHLDDKYIKYQLQRNPLRKDEKIMKLYEKIALKQHFANLQGTSAAEKFIKKSLSILEDTLGMKADASQMSMQPTTGGRATRASLLSQLTRYGTLEEPEGVDDIAYITPDMLEDEEETRVMRRRLKRQQTVGDDATKAPQLRLLLSKPGSMMDTRAMSSNLAMDERSDLMFLLQEKNKRLERFKRSATQMAAESSYVNAVPSAMATIPEDPIEPLADSGTGSSLKSAPSHPGTKDDGVDLSTAHIDEMKGRGPIVRKAGVGKQSSLFLPRHSLSIRRVLDLTEVSLSPTDFSKLDRDPRMAAAAKSKRGMFADRPSTISQVVDQPYPPHSPNAATTAPAVASANVPSQVSFAFGTKGRKDRSKQERLQGLHDMDSVETDESALGSAQTSSTGVRKSGPTKDRNNSNLTDKPSNARMSNDSIELHNLNRSDTIDEVLGILASDPNRDVERGEGKPLAQSSQDSARGFPLATLKEMSEEHSSPGRPGTADDARPLARGSEVDEFSDQDESNETDALVKDRKQTSKDDNVST